MNGPQRPVRDNDAHIAPLLLSSYADGETRAEDRERIEAHLASCATCRVRLDDLRAVTVTLSTLARTSPSADVFERVLAGARQIDDDSTVVAREGLRRRWAFGQARLREVRAPDINTLTPAPPRIRRAGWRAPLTGALPLIAALLLVAFAAGLLVRASLSSYNPVVSVNPTPTIPLSDTLNATQDKVRAVKKWLAFEPATPSYLPNGARLGGVRLLTSGAGQTALDISWSMSAGPLQALHLREQPPGAVASGFNTQSAVALGIAWQVAQAPVWRQLTDVEGIGWRGVGQTRPTVTLLLDAQPAPGASMNDVVAALRLTSLSLDAQYAPPGMAISAPVAGSLQRAIATVDGGGGQTWAWDLTLSADPLSNYRRSTISSASGVSVTEITYAGAGIIRDNVLLRYQIVPGPTATTPPPSGATEIAFDANSFLATGQLWNLGPISRQIPGMGERRVYDLYRVDTMRPEHIYADVTTGNVLAIFVDTSVTVSPGGDGSPQPYVTSAVCQPYTVTYQWLIFEPASQSAATFNTQPPRGYRPGAVSLPFSCGG
ncbi:MAG TPA: zf-HC2 domain-containing protein [Ktedonobacterales bacterium]